MKSFSWALALLFSTILCYGQELHPKAPEVPESMVFAGQRIRFDTDDLYERMDRELIAFTYMLIQERRPPTREGLQKLVQNVEAAATQAAMSQGLERPELRMVFARPEFIEKLFLHQRGYDDRIVEYAKYQLLGNTEGLDPAKHRLHYDFSHDDGQLLHFIVFSRKGHRPVRMLQVPMEEYRALAAEFDQSPEARAELERAFPGCLVDVDHFFEA